MVKILLSIAIFFLLIAKLFAYILDMALKKRGTEQSFVARIDEIIRSLSRIHRKPIAEAEVLTLGILGPFGYTLEINILKHGYYFTVHCIDCLKRYHPKLYEAITSKGEEKAIIASDRIKQNFLKSPDKFSIKADEDYLDRIMKHI